MKFWFFQRRRAHDSVPSEKSAFIHRWDVESAVTRPKKTLQGKSNNVQGHVFLVWARVGFEKHFDRID